MKTIKQGVIAAALFLAASARTLAIEDLKIAVVCPDVVLSWPSVDGETYIVQYRPTLDTNDAWVTLTNSLPAYSGTNLTTFVHSNMVDCPTGQVFGMMSSGGGSGESASLSGASEEEDSKLTEPMLMPKDESSPPAPLQIFPPGLDLSGWIIIWPDGSTEEWTKEFAEKYFAAQAEGQGGPQPDSGGGANNTGFYQVVRFGPHLFGITNGTKLQGYVEIPLELGATNLTEYTGMAAYADGNPAIGAEVEPNELGYPILKWDTTLIPNGTYSANLEANFADEPSITNEPVSITISNLISFPNYFTRIFGDQMWIYAVSAITNVDYELAMYDEQTNYIGSFYDYTSDGVISFVWDLTAGGPPLTNTSFHGDFYLTPHTMGPSGAGGGAASGNAKWIKEQAWNTGGDGMVVAWAALNGNSQLTGNLEQMMLDGAVNILDGNYTLSPFNVANGTAFRLVAATRTALLGYLADPAFRNFYFFGHGSPTSIAGISAGSVINDIAIRQQLGNFLSSPKPTNAHPYRLVFLDGCSTGRQKFSEVFGIPALKANVAYFSTAGVRARAFLGFKEDENTNPNQTEFRSSMMAGFWNDWLSLKRLDLCVSNAVAYQYYHLPSSWVIHGAVDLRRNSVP